jgi:hypothetical protein
MTTTTTIPKDYKPYILGILRKRLNYVNGPLLLSDLRYAFDDVGVDPEYIRQLACQATSWSQFKHYFRSEIDRVEREKGRV